MFPVCHGLRIDPAQLMLLFLDSFDILALFDILETLGRDVGYSIIKNIRLQ